MASIRANAFRQAGYATACFEFGALVNALDIDCDSNEYMRVADTKASYLSSFAADSYSRERAQGEKEVRINLAGGIARRRAEPKTYGAVEDEEDRDRAQEIVWYLVGGWGECAESESESARTELVAYMKMLNIQTERFVDKRWTEIEAVAEALLKHRRLTGKQISEVIVRSINQQRHTGTTLAAVRFIWPLLKELGLSGNARHEK